MQELLSLQCANAPPPTPPPPPPRKAQDGHFCISSSKHYYYQQAAHCPLQLIDSIYKSENSVIKENLNLHFFSLFSTYYILDTTTNFFSFKQLLFIRKLCGACDQEGMKRTIFFLNPCDIRINLLPLNTHWVEFFL